MSMPQDFMLRKAIPKLNRLLLAFTKYIISLASIVEKSSVKRAVGEPIVVVEKTESVNIIDAFEQTGSVRIPNARFASVVLRVVEESLQSVLNGQAELRGLKDGLDKASNVLKGRGPFFGLGEGHGTDESRGLEKRGRNFHGLQN
jgi:hypothetical protein